MRETKRIYKNEILNFLELVGMKVTRKKERERTKRQPHIETDRGTDKKRDRYEIIVKITENPLIIKLICFSRPFKSLYYVSRLNY